MRLGEIFADVNDALDKAFRDKAIKRFGPKHGWVKKALEDAMRLWLSEKESETIPSS